VSETDALIEDTVDGYARKYLIPASNYLAAFIRTALAVVWGSVVTWVASVNTAAGDWISDQSLWAQAAAFAFVVGVVNFAIAWVASKTVPLPGGRSLPLSFLGYLLIVNKKPDYQSAPDVAEFADPQLIDGDIPEAIMDPKVDESLLPDEEMPGVEGVNG
jgi:hypothetical protein